jgi:membrane fusion protein (multidrug efflux system)
VELVLADGHMYEHKGKLESASGIIDRTTGSIQLKVIFPNPENEILSGSSGVVKIPATYKGCITVPQSATYELQDKVMIFVVGEGNTVTRKIITIEGISGKDYVVSGGLDKGDRIVTQGADKLKDGMVITPKE